MLDFGGMDLVRRNRSRTVDGVKSKPHFRIPDGLHLSAEEADSNSANHSPEGEAMPSTTVAEYLDQLPPDRKRALSAIRKAIRKHLPKELTEGIQYGMIGYYVPHSIFPDGYHCDPSQPLPVFHLASQKNHMAFYAMSLYSDPVALERFTSQWKDHGKKLNMGKSCVRFKSLEDACLDAIVDHVSNLNVQNYIDTYVAQRDQSGKTPKRSKKAAAKRKGGAKKTAKKRTVKKTTTKKTAKKKSAAVKKTAKKKATKKKRTVKKKPK